MYDYSLELAHAHFDELREARQRSRPSRRKPLTRRRPAPRPGPRV